MIKDLPKDDEAVESLIEQFTEFAFSSHEDEITNARIAQELIAIIPPERLIDVVRGFFAIAEYRILYSTDLGDADIEGDMWK